ncbi:hypothetical protein ACP4OV_014489 [Aristida adscensionis]
MAMHDSPLPLLLLLVVVSVVVDVPAALAAGGALEKICGSTNHPKTCVETLKANPDSAAAATPRRLAELAFDYIVKEGPPLSAEAKRTAAALTSEAGRNCLNNYEGEVAGYFTPLVKIASVESDAKFKEAKATISSLLEIPAGAPCTDEALAAASAMIDKLLRFEDFFMATGDLFNEAVKTDPGLAPAPAPQSAPADGAR